MTNGEEREEIVLPEVAIKNEKDLFHILNQPPPPEHVKELNGNRYLPISFIEAKLRQVFGPLGWNPRNMRRSVIVNEEVGEIELWVKCPLTKEWLIYEGAAAVQIQMRSGSKVLDVGSKISNCMGKMHPNLKSRCIVNAAKCLGNVFGGNLGRKKEDQETISRDIANAEYLAFKQLAKSATSIAELQIAVDELPTPFIAISGVQNIIQEESKRLSQNQLPAGAAGQTLFEQS